MSSWNGDEDGGNRSAGSLVSHLVAWLPVVAYMGLIFFLSGRPSMVQEVPGHEKIPYLNKYGHIVEYGVLGWLLRRALTRSRMQTRLGTTRMALLIASLYGISDELHQYFVPTRLCEFSDMVIDTLGAAIGLWVKRTLESRVKS